MLLEAKWATVVSKAFRITDSLSNANREADVNTIVTSIVAPEINSEGSLVVFLSSVQSLSRV